MLCLLFAGLAIVILIFPWLSLGRRDPVIARWSALLIACCGVRWQARSGEGECLQQASPRRALIVCNHVSWLDIFVVLAHRPAHFVAKIEIATWPLIGRLVRGAGTLFIERGRRHAVHQLNDRIESMLNAGRAVAVFPEGTTSDGRRLLPFHANLLEPALRCEVPVLPLGLRYLDEDGSPSEVVDFTGDTTLLASMWRILGQRRLLVEVWSLSPVSGQNRHELARAARASLAHSLVLPMDERIPEPLQRARAGG
jgi:1-acyl-sn-glycerol-3-phosphate acyltransferase